MATEIRLHGDGSGTLAVSVALDEESARDLVAAGLVPTSGLAEAAAAAEGWRVTPVEGLTAAVRLERDFTEAGEVQVLLAALGRDLGVEDGTAWDGLGLAVQPDGTIVLRGAAGVVAPTVAGAEGAGVTFDGRDLATYLDERGREAVRHDLQITWDGEVGATDADRVTGQTLVWELPTGSLRAVHASLSPSPGPSAGLLVTLALAAGGIALLLTLMLRRR